MKYIYTLFIALFVSGSVLAQTAFVCTPSSSVTNVIGLNTFASEKIRMENLTNDSLTFGWTNIINTFDTAWDYSLCDYVSCYTGIPASGTMSTVGGTIKGFLTISLNPKSVEATGIAKFWVFDTSNPSDGDTVTFIFESSASVGISNISHNDLPIFYPNPANKIIHFTKKADRITVYSIRGSMMIDRTIKEDNNPNLDISQLVNGVYFVQTHIGENSSIQKLVKQ